MVLKGQGGYVGSVCDHLCFWTIYRLVYQCAYLPHTSRQINRITTVSLQVVRQQAFTSGPDTGIELSDSSGEMQALH
jgi:hypothetical protein